VCTLSDIKLLVSAGFDSSQTVLNDSDEMMLDCSELEKILIVTVCDH